MPDREKVFDALRNCITEPKCRDCPWEDCDRFECKRVDVPVSLILDVLQLLKEQDDRIRELEEKLETITKWRMNAGAFD